MTYIDFLTKHIIQDDILFFIPMDNKKHYRGTKYLDEQKISVDASRCYIDDTFNIKYFFIMKDNHLCFKQSQLIEYFNDYDNSLTLMDVLNKNKQKIRKNYDDDDLKEVFKNYKIVDELFQEIKSKPAIYLSKESFLELWKSYYLNLGDYTLKNWSININKNEIETMNMKETMNYFKEFYYSLMNNFYENNMSLFEDFKNSKDDKKYFELYKINNELSTFLNMRESHMISLEHNNKDEINMQILRDSIDAKKEKLIMMQIKAGLSNMNCFLHESHHLKEAEQEQYEQKINSLNQKIFKVGA